MGDDSLSAADLRSATVRGLRWTVIARPAVEILLLGSMVVLAHLISPAEFGRYAVAAVAGDLALMPAAGVGAALVQRRTVSREHLQAGFALALLSGLLLAGLIAASTISFVVPVFGRRTADLLWLSTPLCLVVAAGTVPSALLQRRLAFRRCSVLDVTNTAVRVVASIAMATAGLGAEGLVLGLLAGGLASTILSWTWAPPPLPRLHRGPVRDVLSYGIFASLAAVSWVGFRNCDYAIVAARLGALPAGLYFRAYQLGVEYQKKVSQVMNTVGFPVLARTQTGGDMDALRSQMVRLLTLALFPLLVMLAIVAPVLVPWMFGHRWAPAAEPTQILAVGGAATLVMDAVGSVLMASGRPRALLGFGWGHFAAYALAVLAVAPLGLTAVAIAAATVHTAFLFVAYALMVRGSGERPLRRLWEDVGPAVLSSVSVVAVAAPASVALSTAHASPVSYLSGVLLVAAATYLLTLRTCFPACLRLLLAFATQIIPRRLLRGVGPLRTLAGTRSAG